MWSGGEGKERNVVEAKQETSPQAYSFPFTEFHYLVQLVLSYKSTVASTTGEVLPLTC